MGLSYLTAKAAQELDQDLMGEEGAFSVDQLMELAGYACAQTIYTVYPPETHPRVLVCCGPGNQGGDGLVAARHLWHFGYKPKLCYPKQTEKELYKRLKKQVKNLGIPEVELDDFEDNLKQSDVVLDAIFGFSFKPPVKAPFDSIISYLKDPSLSAGRSVPPIVSADVPSAWDVEKGNVDDIGFVPQVLLSLTAPKEGVREFQEKRLGRHFLGGRFVPPNIAEKYKLELPEYKDDRQIVEITKPGAT